MNKPSRHPRQHTGIRKIYKFNNGVIIEVGWHYGWECRFIEVFYEDKHKQYFKQRETVRELFKQIRLDIAVMIEPKVEEVIRRLNGGEPLNNFYAREYHGQFLYNPRPNVIILSCPIEPNGYVGRLQGPTRGPTPEEKRTLMQKIRGIFK